ncbi:UDP-N-acetylmuramoyl-L-alanine--D-glutamate ligase [Fluviispira multicolorata]|uniref:UDP-N-acetylmuramoylalanine--D-glutamate ligase n=1 Tax=Fluviispira multicolorata TaxID=2654512 RepID=A0A833JDP4_9BACT|nr:UDP-N-acetylmuramoyl-L-alanine--D-glutamate ligase [Fluviispira multicolorata]KAB8030872.1 UDP-N-acetylmuramoyl-L-alanine--D-glutamate ligase [Fluviispira multicolorata]
MAHRPKIEGVHFYIAGAAKSGVSAAKILKKHGANVFVTEENLISKNIENELILHQIPYEYGFHSIEKIKNNCDVLVISPGISLNKEIAIICKKNKIPIVSEIEVASWFIPEKCIILGITGTNGKSTTTHYAAQLFERAGYKAISCGNIGISMSQAVFENISINLLSVELSSYQLETTYSMRPTCTVFLNLQNDHLGRYENIQEYIKAKWRLVLLTHDSGIAIIDKDVMHLAVNMGLSLPRAKIILIESSSPKKFDDKLNTPIKARREYDIRNQISFGKILPSAIYHELKKLTINELMSENELEIAYAKYDNKDTSVNIFIKLKSSTKTWEIRNPCLPGEHNMINILCASLMAMHLGIDDNIILSQWESETTEYNHLPHRLEFISNTEKTYIDKNGDEKSLILINDSKATNVESTLVALKSLNRPIHLLLGGLPKGDNYLPIGTFFRKNLVQIYPFGKAAENIQLDLKSYKNKVADSSENMLAAADLALNKAKNGDIILLSPACSSFDEFRNFEHRGNVFREWTFSCLKENKK